MFSNGNLKTPKFSIVNSQLSIPRASALIAPEHRLQQVGPGQHQGGGQEQQGQEEEAHRDPQAAVGGEGQQKGDGQLPQGQPGGVAVEGPEVQGKAGQQGEDPAGDPQGDAQQHQQPHRRHHRPVSGGVAREPAEAGVECPQDYVDIQLLTVGRERVAVTPAAELEVFEQHGDFWGCRGENRQTLVLRPGDFLVVFPEEGHRLKIAVEGPEAVSKVVFKIRVKED